MDLDPGTVSLPLPNQLKYIQAICNRTIPHWLRCYVEPDDIAQEAMIRVWRASRGGQPIRTGLLTCIARHAVADAIRQFNGRKARIFRCTTLLVDAPAEPPTTPFDHRQVAEAVLGADVVDALLDRPQGRARDAACHRARRKVQDYWQRHGCWPGDA